MVNDRTKKELEQAGSNVDMTVELPGYSVFLRDGETVYYSYSTAARGVEMLNFTTQFLNLTPFSRQEG